MLSIMKDKIEMIHLIQGKGDGKMNCYSCGVRMTIVGLFGYPTSTDIKKAELKAVNYETAKKIIKEYEWLGTMGTTQLHYGIFYDGVLGGVVCFGYFQAMNTSHDGHPYAYYVTKEFANKGIQLTRGACAWWVHEHSGSKLIGYGLREMQSKGYKYAIAFS